MDIESIKGIGEKTLEVLKKLNIYMLSDLITYYPYRYNILKVIPIKEALNDEVITIKGIIDIEPRVYYVKRNLNRMTFRINSDGLLINVTIFNRAFYKKNLKAGRIINLIGKYDKNKNNFLANDIKFDVINKIEIEPIYHLTNGIKRNTLIKVIKEAFTNKIDLDDFIPNYLITKYNFINKLDSAKKLHFPESTSDIKKAKIRIIYEEFFIFMFKMYYLKHKYELNNIGLSRKIDKERVKEFINSLPFTLTNDQQKAVIDIYNDLVNNKRMNRLILGDVGSGKTLIAEIAMYMNYLSGYQSSLMAPTEILARQHYNNMLELYKNTDIKIGLLVGSMKKREKEQIYKKIECNDLDIIVGTHAIISENVKFPNLGLVITDEQHRFGVNQRNNLQNKGIKCDVLYMSATPIPRTYALTIYGDMDTSLIKTKPNGRLDIITKVVKEKDLKNVLFAMLEEIKKGHQIYVVAPLIEDEEEKNNLNDIKKLTEKFNIAFNNKVNIEILHGKMKDQEKEIIMQQYKEGIIKVLISTTVIEVGVDVKNSTMMIIFNAERFGLATLHQLRGRVGRNSLQSYCYLICNMDIARLKVMEESNDGFYISQKDFELRGEGDLFGTRQSGDMVFKVGDLKRDYKILYQCKKDAQEFIENNIHNNFNKYPQYHKIIKEIEFID